MEFKRLALEIVDIKFGEDERTFSGYAAKFNGVDSYGDTVDPGAFKSTLKARNRPVRMRWNHFGPVIGKWTEIYEDEKGLFVKGELTAGHSTADDVYASMKHGSVDGLSIGYRVIDEYKKDGIRHLKKIDLVEVSVVEEPADLGAKVEQVKHQDELITEINSLKDAESFLREAGGFSRSIATKFVSRLKHVSLGEQERKEATPMAKLIEQLKTKEMHNVRPNGSKAA